MNEHEPKQKTGAYCETHELAIEEIKIRLRDGDSTLDGIKKTLERIEVALVGDSAHGLIGLVGSTQSLNSIIQNHEIRLQSIETDKKADAQATSKLVMWAGVAGGVISFAGQFLIGLLKKIPVIILAAVLLLGGCAHNRPPVHLSDISVPVTNAKGNIVSAASHAETLGKTVKDAESLKELDALKADLKNAQIDLNQALNATSKQDGQITKLNTAYDVLKKEKDEADSAIWHRNWIILGLAASNLALLAWTFRSQIAGLALLAGS